MDVFDRQLVRARRERAAAGFADHGFLVAEVAERLVDRLRDVTRDFPAAVDLGCHTGQVARALRGDEGVGWLAQADLAPTMATRAGEAGWPALACDEEWLPFADASLDLVTSCLSLHWVNDLPGALVQIRRALRSDGLFLAATFGIETLRELKDCLFETEMEAGGISPHVSPFVDVRDAGGLLQRAGLALPVVDADTITVTYENPLGLLRDLRGMGETNAVRERARRPLRRDVLFRALDLYQRRHALADGRVPATFEIVTMTAWAPDASQQTPLRPGSAQARLADALGTREHGTGEPPG